MKRKVLLTLLVILILTSAYAAWLVFGSITAFEGKNKFLYIHQEQARKDSLLAILKREKFVRNTGTFTFFANRLNLWNTLKPGKFEIKQGESALTIVRKLRNNQQSPVNLVINKLRIREDLARLIGRQFSTDSARAMQFVNNNDSLRKFGVDTNTVFTLIIPNTYTFYWNTSVSKILKKLADEKDKFWTKENRLQKAASMGLTPIEVYTIASIVEEETNKHDEKGNIASVYLNRINTGMPLQADPTIRFALKDFTIKRVYHKYLDVISPYNTYRNLGLPPGPICTPSSITIDKVLAAPKTDYLYFVAKSDFSGYHVFASNYAEHQKYASEYQKALDKYLARNQIAR